MDAPRGKAGPHHLGEANGPARTVVRARRPAVALETTVLVHGVPRAGAPALAGDLASIVRAGGAHPAFIGLFHGCPTVGLTDEEVLALIDAPTVAKANTSNLGALIHRREHAATTVSATMELAASAGVAMFATGGLGGVHRGYGERLDISADLAAMTRFPVAVVSSGVKSILDVESTREALETLGVPVVGFRTHRFPSFYMRESAARVDARFDNPADLARFLRAELARTGRAVMVANPIPESDELDAKRLDAWLAEAHTRAESEGAAARDVTPRVLALLHELSGGTTLRANLALIKDNTRLAAELAARQ